MKKDLTSVLEPSVDVGRALAFAYRNDFECSLDGGSGFIDTQTAICAKEAGEAAPPTQKILTLDVLRTHQYVPTHAENALRQMAQ